MHILGVEDKFVNSKETELSGCCSCRKGPRWVTEISKTFQRLFTQLSFSLYIHINIYLFSRVPSFFFHRWPNKVNLIVKPWKHSGPNGDQMEMETALGHLDPPNDWNVHIVPFATSKRTVCGAGACWMEYSKEGGEEAIEQEGGFWRNIKYILLENGIPCRMIWFGCGVRCFPWLLCVKKIN